MAIHVSAECRLKFAYPQRQSMTSILSMSENTLATIKQDRERERGGVGVFPGILSFRNWESEIFYFCKYNEDRCFPKGKGSDNAIKGV